MFLNNKSLIYGVIYWGSGAVLILIISRWKYSFLLSYDRILINSSRLGLNIQVDIIRLIFGGVVIFISGNILIYSHWYIGRDLFRNRFRRLINLFVLSILLVIFTRNLMALIVGWDGLGVVSFLLIVYYQRPYSLKCGSLTFLTNRLGDIALLVRIAALSWQGTSYLGVGSSIGMMVLIASITKRAQVPFSSWLPAAMAAPTPVRALVHSSTLVTAGVYILIRFNVEGLWVIRQIIFITGLITIIIAGISAIVECDLKKVIALSTLRQLGLMFTSLSINMKNLAFFHLLAHAGFKARIFLCAGVLIHIRSAAQDIRFMGGRISRLPITTTCFNVCSISLRGLPFLSGYYSKDIILEAFIGSHLAIVVHFLLFVSVALTVAYRTRLIMSVSRNLTLNLSENKEAFCFAFPIICLSFRAIMFGKAFSINYITEVNPLILSQIIMIILILAGGMGVGILAYIYKPTNLWLRGIWGLIRINKISVGVIIPKVEDVKIRLERGWMDGKNTPWEQIFSLLQKRQDVKISTQIGSVAAIFVLFLIIWL